MVYFNKNSCKSVLKGRGFSPPLRSAHFFDEGEDDPDDTPAEEVKASLRRALQQAKAGQTRPISELWERIDFRF
jgi:hypothetical protein